MQEVTLARVQAIAVQAFANGRAGQLEAQVVLDLLVSASAFARGGVKPEALALIGQVAGHLKTAHRTMLEHGRLMQFDPIAQRRLRQLQALHAEQKFLSSPGIR